MERRLTSAKYTAEVRQLVSILVRRIIAIYNPWVKLLHLFFGPALRG